MTEARKPKSHLVKLQRYHVGDRRKFLTAGVGLSALGIGLLAFGTKAGASRAEVVPGLAKGAPPIRPPGGVDDDVAFRASCISCGLCGVACDVGTIRFFPATEFEHGPMTPYLDLRARACTLCMRCTEVCPSGALLPITADMEVIKKEVHMGTAVVDPELCISYLGRICGNCHDACPLPGYAIRLLPPATPLVLEDGCVGCGRCVEECPQVPTAIRVKRGVA